MKKIAVLFLLVVLMFGAKAQIITTVAGGYNGTGDTATKFWVDPYNVAIDNSGNVLIADPQYNLIRKINTSGILSVFAGDEENLTGGNGGQATTAQINAPTGIAMDNQGNVYIVEQNGNVIREVNNSGIISTIAGTGLAGYSGDGGPATNAEFNSIFQVELDKFGNIYISDAGNNRVRMINTSGIINTIAGTGIAGSTGNGGPATSARLNRPLGVSVDTNANLYIADYNNNQIRMVNSSGIISKFAGSGVGGYGGDGGQATAALLNKPFGVTADDSGNIYIADYSNNRVRKVNTSGVINSFAQSAGFKYPTGVYVNNSGLYVSDHGNVRVVKVDYTNTISTIAGNGNNFFTGIGEQATSSQIGMCFGLALDTASNMYIDGHSSIFKVTNSGILTTFAGNGISGYTGDGGPATAAELGFVVEACTDKKGNVFAADINYAIIREINSSGVISTFAGTGTPSSPYGDGGPATAAGLSGFVRSVCADKAGNVYLTDAYSIRKVNTNGIITRFAGTYSGGFSGDGGPATAAEMGEAVSCAVDDSGNVYFADYYEEIIRKVNTSGIITTIAGIHNVGGHSGDGGPATAAKLNLPIGLAVDGAGNVYIAEDSTNYDIRMVNTSGIISTIAGTGIRGFNGDGINPTLARVHPYPLACDKGGNLYLSDITNLRIRKIAGPPCTLTASICSTISVTCYGGSNGCTTVCPGGGTSPYTYTWTPNVGFGSNVCSLTAGCYTVTVKDAVGCTVTVSSCITQPTQLRNSISSKTNVSCNGGNDGRAACTAGGGTGAYTFLWSDVNTQTSSIATGLTVGTYTVTIKDSCGATASASVVITQPNAINITTSSVAANAGCNGSAWATVSGGNAPYSYSWTGGSTTDTITNQCAGNYCCVITDANGCKDSNCVTINNVTGIGTIKSGQQVTIFPNPNNGSFNLTLVTSSRVEIYNVLGQNIYAAKLKAGSNELNLTNQGAGVYLYRVLTDIGNLVNVGKFVIEK